VSQSFAVANVYSHLPDDTWAHAAAAAIVGGTTSELTGGSFEDGAITAVYSHMLNDRAHAITLRSSLRAVNAGARFGRAAAIGGVAAAADGPFPIGDGIAVVLITWEAASITADLIEYWWQAEQQDQSKRFTPDQQAAVDLAKEAKNKGNLTKPEAETLVDWGQEVGFPQSRGPETHSGRRHGSKPHIHVGPINHIPVK
jgi:hypothetical protein